MDKDIMKIKCAKSYTEILEIMKYFAPEYLSKIPKKLIIFFEKYRDKNYEFHIDINKEFANQDISIETSQILAFLILKYIGNEEQKKEVAKILEKNESKNLK